MHAPAEAARVSSLPTDSKSAQIGPTLDAFPPISGKTIWFTPKIVLHNGLRLGTLTRKTLQDIDALLLRSPDQSVVIEDGRWTRFFPERNALRFTISVLESNGDRQAGRFVIEPAGAWSQGSEASMGGSFVNGLAAIAPEHFESWQSVAAVEQGSDAAIPSPVRTSQQWEAFLSDGQAAQKVHWAQVPLPAATWLFLSALAGLGALGWYRRRSD